VRPEDVALGKSLKELALPSRTGTVVLAIRSRDEVITSPGADYVLLEGDIVILVGKHEQLLSALELIQGARKNDESFE
jgi:CPA2 family monovalent cation:H+ antiporter-2